MNELLKRTSYPRAAQYICMYIYCENIFDISLFFFQNNLERQEYATRSRYTNEVSALEQEVAVLKQKLTSEQDHSTKSAHSFKVGKYFV